MPELTLTSYIIQRKLAAQAGTPSNVLPSLTNFQPADAPSFQVNSSPFPNYPAPGAGTVQLLSYQVPQGLFAFITQMVILNIGGGYSDGSGNVIWRCWINGYSLDGLENITAHIGSFDSPAPVQIRLIENDSFYITAEVPGAQPPMPPTATTGARIRGWTYPIGKVTTK